MISVIVPVYNGEKYIKRCLDSILNQSLKDIEVVIVDDGSTDKTKSIVLGYDDPRISYAYRENCGQGTARNCGIRMSRGEYLAFVDADDTICSDMLECMMNAMNESGADVVQCGINDIRGGVSAPRAVELNETVTVTDREEYARVYFLGKRHTYEVCNKLIRKEFLKKNCLKFDDTREIFSEDLLLNIRMLSYINKITFINKPLYNYYISDSGHCRGGSGRLEKIGRLFSRAVRFCCDEVKPAVECTAAEVLIEYCAQTEDKEYVYEVLDGKQFEKYLMTSRRYIRTVKHFALMTLLLESSAWLKRIIIKQYVGRYSRQ